MSLSKLIHFIFGSNILDKYEIPIGDDPYQENVAETMGDLLIAMAYNRRWYEPACVMKFLQYIVIYYSIAYTTRTIGRICSEDYRKFTNVLMEVTESREPSPDAEAQLRNYDYEIFMAPIEYIAETRAGKKFVATDEKEFADMGPLWDLVKDPVSAFVVHTFGRRMLYPGATSLFKTLFAGVLKAGRRKLVKEHGGRRNVLLTEDGNCIDSMFVDNRHKSSTGSKLVVTCEGNAGFYEVGIANAPLAKGYSILGWNHPGFAQSSGLPYPDQEQNAVEAVMQFATKKLGFKESDIILYGWSIGGFTATWAAANYNVGSLLLDATFDDLLPLAIAKMPKPVDFVVQYAVRKYLNLPISKQLSMYNGPVRLIRRSDDDIIVTDEFGSAADRRASNRANQLLVDLIESRHPGLLRNESDRNIAKEWLALSPVERVSAPTDNITTLTRYRLYNGLEDKQRRELIFHYCDKYLVDFDAGHNMPLPEDYFNPPGP
ncbi:hypothetical protein QR680_012412 [Steinernema hermaphroditum]|uniref:AB hydrolase-1 domain-containing protein n=1 Tax=Steinernema hermaphroditum TaxID=289476 RepID=A0AA39I1Z3_9BILA|nr:hypothetical protein QR680_012412 [Steinernema hermaphroditum]